MDAQVTDTQAPDQSIVPRLQKVLPHLQSILRPTVRLVNEKKIDVSEREHVAVVGGKLGKGAGNGRGDRGVIFRHDFGS
jgi:hypothetical protein